LAEISASASGGRSPKPDHDFFAILSLCENIKKVLPSLKCS
jgi:hypothetical protein